jgi:hypothetical protein
MAGVIRIEEVHPSEVVGRAVERQGGPQVVPLPAEGVRQAGKAPHDIRMCRFVRSTWDVQIRSSAGVLEITIFSADIMAGGE